MRKISPPRRTRSWQNTKLPYYLHQMDRAVRYSLPGFTACFVRSCLILLPRFLSCPPDARLSRVLTTKILCAFLFSPVFPSSSQRSRLQNANDSCYIRYLHRKFKVVRCDAVSSGEQFSMIRRISEPPCYRIFLNLIRTSFCLFLKIKKKSTRIQSAPFLQPPLTYKADSELYWMLPMLYPLSD